MNTTDIILLINCSLHPIKVAVASNYASAPAERSIKQNCDSLSVTMKSVLTMQVVVLCTRLGCVLGRRATVTILSILSNFALTKENSIILSKEDQNHFANISDLGLRTPLEIKKQYHLLL